MTTQKKPAMHPAFTRGFRLHHNGRALDGAQFPSGRVYVIDDPEYRLATAAASLEELLTGYHGARVEWPGDQGETVTVPMALLLDLVNIAAHVSLGKRAAFCQDRPYPDALARRTNGVLSDFLGYDVAERAAKQEAARAIARGGTHL